MDEPTKKEMGQIYIVDDDADVTHSIVYALNSVGYSILSFATADGFLQHSLPSEPSVALIDILLPGMTGLNLCREIVARELPCSFIVISGHADVMSAVEAMRMGAVDLLEKPFSHQRLLESVNEAFQIARCNFDRRTKDEDLRRRLQSLSPRELTVLNAVAEGLVTKEIAVRLDVSARTIDVHRSRIMQKLKIESPSQLASYLALLQQSDRRS